MSKGIPETFPVEIFGAMLELEELLEESIPE